MFNNLFPNLSIFLIFKWRSGCRYQFHSSGQDQWAVAQGQSTVFRPDVGCRLTYTVDWALKTNLLSVCPPFLWKLPSLLPQVVFQRKVTNLEPFSECVPRKQKLGPSLIKKNPVLSMVLCLKHGVGQNIALHAWSADRNFVCLISATREDEGVNLVECMYFIFTRMPGWS